MWNTSTKEKNRKYEIQWDVFKELVIGWKFWRCNNALAARTRNMQQTMHLDWEQRAIMQATATINA